MRVDDIRFSYGAGDVLRGVSFAAEYGEFLSVLGPNGVGKSTLFKCMLGLLAPTEGETTIDGKPIREMSAPELARSIAYIPQSHNPVFNFSVLDMVLMGTTAQVGAFSAPGKEQIERAQQALERLGIAHLRDRGYGNVSGGERQMTLIARAIAQRARILVMDEGKIAMQGAPLEVFTRVEEIRALGLDAPEMILLAEELRKRGIPAKDVMTVDEMVVELCRLKS